MEINSLLQLLTEQKASDLHLIVGLPPILRIAQELVHTSLPILTRESNQDLVYQLLSDEQKANLLRERELDLAGELSESRFRINIHFQRGNVGCAIRRIPKQIPTREELRLPKQVEDLCSERKGLVLVTGPTGCGKTSTQASMIDYINATRGCHIVTVEDPIEYVHVSKKSIVEQREVGSDTLSFSSALKRVLRQDPNVILVGEMRDLETIQAAITAAETGHLVISTLHTADAPQTVDRIVDVFPPHQQPQIRLQLSMTLKGIISQQLLPLKDQKDVIPAVEILIATPAVSNVIRKATTQELYSVIEIGSTYGMQSMDASLKQLYESKLITYEKALSCAHNPEQLAKSIKAVM